MSRSLTLKPEFIAKVKEKVKYKFPRQKDLAEDLGLSLATVSNLLNSKPVDHINFTEICDRLGLSWQEVAYWGEAEINPDSLFEAVASEPKLDAQESFIYVDRPPTESSFLAEILRPGGLVRIRAPRCFGKTALTAKMLAQVSQKGYRHADLNFHLASEKQLADLSSCLKWFCAAATQGLALPNTLKDYWDEEFYTSKLICTEYFEKYLLANSEAPLVICLDEVERLFDFPQVASEFLGLLRAWHEKANISQVWRRLRLVVVHSTEVYIPLNLNESPFNVGIALELPDFTPAQVQDLAKQYKLSLSEGQIRSLMDWVGGNPELVRLAFVSLQRNPNQILENILAAASTEAGIFKVHLRHLWNLIQRSPALVDSLAQVMLASQPVTMADSPLTFQLISLGVVVAVSNGLKPRYRLYQQYFQQLLPPLSEH